MKHGSRSSRPPCLDGQQFRSNSHRPRTQCKGVGVVPSTMAKMVTNLRTMQNKENVFDSKQGFAMNNDQTGAAMRVDKILSGNIHTHSEEDRKRATGNSRSQVEHGDARPITNMRSDCRLYCDKDKRTSKKCIVQYLSIKDDKENGNLNHKTSPSTLLHFSARNSSHKRLLKLKQQAQYRDHLQQQIDEKRHTLGTNMKTKNKCTVAQYSQQGTKDILLRSTKNGPQAMNVLPYTVNNCCLPHREYDQSGINVLLCKTKGEKEHHLTYPIIVDTAEQEKAILLELNNCSLGWKEN